MPRRRLTVAPAITAALVAAVAVLPASARADVTYPSQRPAPDVVNELAYYAAGWAYKTDAAALRACPNGVEQWQASAADLADPVGSVWGRGWHADDDQQCALWVSDNLVLRTTLRGSWDLAQDFTSACIAVAHEWLHARGIPHDPVGLPPEMTRVMSTAKMSVEARAPEFCLRWTYEHTLDRFRVEHFMRSALTAWLPDYVIDYARAHIRGARKLLR